jgi:hypothetical protein
LKTIPGGGRPLGHLGSERQLGLAVADVEARERVDQAGGVAGHVREGVLIGIEPPRDDLGRRRRGRRDVSRAPNVAVVEPHDVKTSAGQLLAQSSRPRDQLASKSHDQDERRVDGTAERSQPILIEPPTSIRCSIGSIATEVPREGSP